MSWMFSYYLAYEKDGKLHPLGPFDAGGEWYPVLSRAMPFISDLQLQFVTLAKDKLDDALVKYFGKDSVGLWCLPLSALPKKKLERTKYCLTVYAMNYSSEDPDWDAEELLEYDSLTPAEYAIKADAELKNGYVYPELDQYGREVPGHSCKEYTLFTWIPRCSEEYESWRIRTLAETFRYSDLLKDGGEIMVILRQS